MKRMYNHETTLIKQLGMRHPSLFRTAVFLILIAVSLPLHAGGKADKFPDEPVDGQSHWTHTIDLDELEEGKHNIVIKAVDEAGNVRIEGPYDFRVDPETDIPVVAVAHPKPDTRVGRMLPIIGTARDDDAVARVEVSVNDGPWRAAAGAEAWSAVLDAGALGDGPHFLSVKSIDINGIESPVETVPFIVDTSAPVGGVTEPVSGALISGKAEFSGIIEDPNGIDSLEISQDGGETWERLRFSKNRDTGSAAFKTTLDSRKLEDGPVVWWFRGTDAEGTVSETPFLFFVDNQGPIVSLELPVLAENGKEALEPAPGDIFLAGTAADQSGVASLRVTAGRGEPQEIPVTPGNPWWTWPLDLSGLRDKQVDVLIVAEDGAGNISETEFKLPLDAEADKPVINIDGAEAIPETIYPTGEAYLTGVFTDDDGIGALVWKAGDLEGRLDGVERSWRLDLNELPAGPVELELTAEDRFGTKGDAIELVFAVAPKPPVITLEFLEDASADAPGDWTPGGILSHAGGGFGGVVVSEAGRGLSLTYVISGGEESSVALKADSENPGRYTFRIPIKKGTEPGVKNFILRAMDPYGGEAVIGSGIYVQAEPDDSGNIPDPRRGDQPVNLPLPFLRTSDGAAILRPGEILQGWTSGASASGVKLEPESPLLKIRGSGSSFTIENVAPGLSEPVKVVLSDGSSSGSVVILTDHEPPRWEMDGPDPGVWSSGVLEVSGTVVDDGGIAEASWSVGGSSSSPVELEEKGDGRFVFAFETDVARGGDGPKILTLTAKDAAGNRSEYELPFVLDTQAPKLEMVLPPSETQVGAKSTLVYAVSGDGLLQEFSLTVDGESWTNAESSSLHALALDLAGYEGLPQTLNIRAVDRAGNVSEQKPVPAYDPVSDKPVTLIQTPVVDSVLRGPTDIAGLVADADEIAAVYWRLDGGDWKKLDGGASFRVSLPWESLEDGRHLVEVYAEDAAGNLGEADSSWFDITRQEAEVELLSPVVGSTNKGTTVLSGESRDANGIAEVWVSFDNGHSFFLAEGATDFDASPSEEPETGDEADAAEDEAASELSPEIAPVVEGEGEVADELAEPVELSYPITRNDIVPWTYAMDTQVLNDGVHTLLIKVIDGAGDEALLAGILEVDNTPPLLAVGDPLEGSLQTGSMTLEGRVVDDGGLESFSAVIERDGEALMDYTELAEGVFHIPFDFAALEAGEVLLRVEAVDTAGNRTAASRSFFVEPGRRSVIGHIVLPVEGGLEGPFFSLSGYVENAEEGDSALLLIDGEEAGALELDDKGRFSREFAPGDLIPGDHRFRVDVLSGGERSESAERFFNYADIGRWVVIDGYPPLMAVGERPLLAGRAGYYLENPPEDDRDAGKAHKSVLRANRPDRIEVSLDGGLTFERAKGVEEWEYRIETSQMGEGDLPILVRARFPEGWAYSRTILRLDKTLPDLKVNETVADGRFNGELTVSGTAEDDQELEDVTVAVRPGGAGRYEVPSFVQGMYFDIAALGATWVNAGLGITFFDDNVKLQFSVGWAPELVTDPATGDLVQARVSGTSLGATLLANVLYLPLGYWWGPKWEPFALSLAIGANFTYFTNFSDAGGGVMSSVVMQMEVPKITFLDRKFITYLAPYVEGKLWFFSSDVDTTPYFTFSMGLRLGLL